MNINESLRQIRATVANNPYLRIGLVLGVLALPGLACRETDNNQSSQPVTPNRCSCGFVIGQAGDSTVAGAIFNQCERTGHIRGYDFLRPPIVVVISQKTGQPVEDLNYVQTGDHGTVQGNCPIR